MKDLRKAIAARLPEAVQLLKDLVATPSLSGQETAAMEIAERAFAAISRTRRVPLSDDITRDADYSDPIADIQYAGRWNLAAWHGHLAHARGPQTRSIAFGGPSQGRLAPDEESLSPGAGQAGKTLLLNTHVDTVPALDCVSTF